MEELENPISDRINIVKSEHYKVGECSITDFVGKELKLLFDKGEPIEVSNSIFERIKKLGWCNIHREEVTSGS